LGKPIVVISAVNLTEGGPLTILENAVANFVSHFVSNYKLIVLVCQKNLLNNINEIKEVEVLEYSYPKKSWLLRICFEYVHCYFISKKIKPYLWISLHDVTPNVQCANKVVYCHNPAPFYKLSFKHLRAEKSLLFFHFFYKIFYLINLRKNKYIIVQQQWMRDEFQNRYKIKNIIVSYPDVQINKNFDSYTVTRNNRYKFFYPSLPRVCKNFETLLKAAEILERNFYQFEVILTFDGSENKYASKLKKKYEHLSSVKFIGLQKREELVKLYCESSCLLFASIMETWGLPITEMKLFNKPIIISNCKYAYETVGNYNKACFFNPWDAVQLSELMKNALSGTLKFNSTGFSRPQPPFANSWKELFSLILS
jgi:glycosyltransferase involved in cell wall biosynthesis